MVESDPRSRYLKLLAAGGAKRIATFRRNVEEGYLPGPESLAYEGLFYNYYFDTGQQDSCSSLFCPSYSPAVTADPFSGEARGGVVLAQVERTSEDATMELKATWEDRECNESKSTTTISFPSDSPEHFANTGVRKAVLPSRYADLLKNWMVYERDRSLAPEEEGVTVPPEEYELGEWEQQSDPSTVSERYQQRIVEFREYFESETEAIGDDSLDRELTTMDAVLDAAE